MRYLMIMLLLSGCGTDAGFIVPVPQPSPAPSVTPSPVPASNEDCEPEEDNDLDENDDDVFEIHWHKHCPKGFKRVKKHNVEFCKRRKD